MSDMNRPLADAILRTFYPQFAEMDAADLASFPLSAWMETYRWLDASGLALYFLDRVKQLQLRSALPAAVWQRLERNLADNRQRTNDTFAEFVRINRAFTAAGVTFVNMKGISLVPYACEDPALRLQLDQDFLIEMRQVQSCAVTLGELGYTLTGVSGSVWEFKAAASLMPSVNDLYKVKPQRSVEVHFGVGRQQIALADQREWTEWDGFSFPVLSSADRFITQVMHVLKHIRGEWTRLSWLLEFRHSVLHWKDDRDFWQQVREQAIDNRELCTAIGAAIVLTTTAFGSFAPEHLTSWTVDTLDYRMRLWLDRYGRVVIMADFPGTKLYLLQPDLAPSGKASAMTKRRRLIPLHKVPNVVPGAGAHGFRSRLRGWSAQLEFARFRLCFHITAGWQYLLEAPRWRKVLAEAPPQRPTFVAADERGLL
jgi:hypothetical protein